MVLLPVPIRDASLAIDILIPNSSAKTFTDALAPSLVMGAKRSRILCFGLIPIPPVVTLRIRTPLSFGNMRQYPEPGYGSVISSIPSLTCS